MVAMPTVDLIVTASWIGALTVVVLAQAVWLYLRHRWASHRAASAERLADAIAFPPGGRSALARSKPPIRAEQPKAGTR
jgi:hypothetical protein